MATSEVVYQGLLRTNAKHLASGSEIITDAPVDNFGKGEAFSPTDLLATSLGCCMLTLIGIAANVHQFNIDGTRLLVTKIMAANPRRVSEIQIEMKLPMNYPSSVKKILETAALTCPVAKSLHTDIRQVVNFIYS